MRLTQIETDILHLQTALKGCKSEQMASQVGPVSEACRWPSVCVIWDQWAELLSHELLYAHETILNMHKTTMLTLHRCAMIAMLCIAGFTNMGVCSTNHLFCIKLHT